MYWSGLARWSELTGGGLMLATLRVEGYRGRCQVRDASEAMTRWQRA